MVGTILQLTLRDVWTLRDAFEGVQILGSLGSGKTSGSGKAMSLAMLRAGFGGLVLTVKPEEAERWEEYCREADRLDDFVRITLEDPFNPGHAGPHAFNFLDYERKVGGPGLNLNLAFLFTTVADAFRGGERSNSETENFWRSQLHKLLIHAINIVVNSTGTVSLSDLNQTIASAPRSPADLSDEGWDAPSAYMRHVLAALPKMKPLPLGLKHDFAMARQYFEQEFPRLDGRLRSSITETFAIIANMLLTHPLWEFFSHGTTFTPEDTFAGKILVLDFPIHRFKDAGRISQIIFKTVWQMAAQAQRQEGDGSTPVFLWADEAHHFVTSHDHTFQTSARSASACTVYLTQNLPNYYKAIGKDTTDALLGCLQLKILHANGDRVTNEWAENAIGKKWRIRVEDSEGDSYNTSPQGYSSGRSRNRSYRHSLEATVLAEEFTTLKKGAPKNDFLVQGYCFRAGGRWNATGENVVFTEFAQTAEAEPNRNLSGLREEIGISPPPHLAERIIGFILYLLTTGGVVTYLAFHFS